MGISLKLSSVVYVFQEFYNFYLRLYSMLNDSKDEMILCFGYLMDVFENRTMKKNQLLLHFYHDMDNNILLVFVVFLFVIDDHRSQVGILSILWFSAVSPFCRRTALTVKRGIKNSEFSENYPLVGITLEKMLCIILLKI